MSFKLATYIEPDFTEEPVNGSDEEASGEKCSGNTV